MSISNKAFLIKDNQIYLTKLFFCQLKERKDVDFAQVEDIVKSLEVI